MAGRRGSSRPSRLIKIGATSIISSSNAAAQTGFTHAHTVPAGLSAQAAAFFLVAYIENAAATVTLTFAGTDLIATGTLLPVNTPGVGTTCVLGAYARRNPTAGAQNLVIGNHTDMRCFVSVMAIFEGVASTPFASGMAVRVSTGLAVTTATIATPVLQCRRGDYLLSLGISRGILSTPISTDGRWVELADAICTGGASSTTHCCLSVNELALQGTGTIASTTTWAASNRCGTIQVPVLSV